MSVVSACLHAHIVADRYPDMAKRWCLQGSIELRSALLYGFQDPGIAS